MWGVAHEEFALTLYCEATSVEVRKSGIWLHESGLIGASPDGIVNDKKIVEVKCPYTARCTLLPVLAENPKGVFLKKPDASWMLNLNNNIV